MERALTAVETRLRATRPSAFPPWRPPAHPTNTIKVVVGDSPVTMERVAALYERV